MNCKKCGKKNLKTAVFCTNCGEELKQEETKKTTTKKAVEARAEAKTKAAEKKAEKVTEEKVTETKKEEGGKGLAIAGMVLGIVGLLFSFFIGPFAFILALLGLIFSIVAKNGKGFKIAGLITSIIAIVIEVIFVIISVLLVGSFFSILGDYIENTDPSEINDVIDEFTDETDTTFYDYKGESPYGTWTCAPFDSNGSYNDEVDDVDDEDKTTLKLHYTDKYEYGPYEDLYDNHYSGKFTYEIEKDKNEENKSNGYKFIMVKGEVEEFMMDGVKQSTDGKGLSFEMELFKDYNYDKALIIFPSTYNMYICER